MLHGASKSAPTGPRRTAPAGTRPTPHGGGDRDQNPTTERGGPCLAYGSEPGRRKTAAAATACCTGSAAASRPNATAAHSRRRSRPSPARLDHRRTRRAARSRLCVARSRDRTASPTLREMADRWRETPSRRRRVDPRAASRRARQRASDPRRAARRRDRRSPTLSTSSRRFTAAGKKRETIRKSVKYLAAVLDYAKVDPNPARDRSVRLPSEETDELEPADRRARRGRLPDDPERASTAAALARLVGCSRRSASTRLWSATTTRPAAAFGCAVNNEVATGAVGRPPRRARRGDRGDPAAAEDRDPEARLFAESGRRAPDLDREGVPGARDPAVVAARSAAPPDLAAPLAGPIVGRGRCVRRSAETLDHGRHLHARPGRRPRGRLRGAARLRKPEAVRFRSPVAAARFVWESTGLAGAASANELAGPTRHGVGLDGSKTDAAPCPERAAGQVHFKSVSA